MHKRTRRYDFRPIAVITAIIFLLSISAPAVIFAGNVRMPPPDIKEKIVVKIEAKDKDAVFVNERRFIVTDKTIILDMGDQHIKLSELIVPCKAEIKYQLGPSKPDPVCLEITVKRIYLDPKKSRAR